MLHVTERQVDNFILCPDDIKEGEKKQSKSGR